MEKPVTDEEYDAFIKFIQEYKKKQEEKQEKKKKSNWFIRLFRR